MIEIFELIKAFNRLEGKVNSLNAKVDLLLESPFKKRVLDSASAARLLGVSTRTLLNLRNEGSIPFIRMRRRILYSASDLLKYLRAVSQSIPSKPSTS